MAKGRMVSITVATDKRLNALSLEAHLVFLMAIPHLDRDGLLAGDAELLAGKVVPRRPELHQRLNAIVDEWCATGLVLAYETPDTRVLFFRGFFKNNSIKYDREGASQFPPPPGFVLTTMGLVPDTECGESKTTPESVLSKSGVGDDKIPLIIKRKEDKEKEMRLPSHDTKDDDTPSRRQVDPEWARAIGTFEDNISLVSGSLLPDMLDIWDTLVANGVTSWWEQAITVAVAANKRSWRYVRGILTRCMAEGHPPGNNIRRNGNSDTLPAGKATIKILLDGEVVDQEITTHG